METVLQNMIFRGYNRYRKPVRNTTTDVPFGLVLSLSSIEKVDEKSQTFSSVVWLIYNWKDEYLRWNTSENGIEYLRVPAEKIWVPSICCLNELAEKMCMTYESVKENEAFIHYTGGVSMHHSIRSTIRCKINLQKYPFDEQRCTFEFFSLIAAIHQLEMNENYSVFETSFAIYNGEWSVVSTEKKIRHIPYERNQSLAQLLEFTINIRRRPTTAILTVMLPIIILSVINVFCFVLPSAAGEKIGMSMAIFLTFAVYSTLLDEAMPSSAENVSWFSIYVTTQVILSAAIIVLQSVLLRVHHQDLQPDQNEEEAGVPQYCLKTLKNEEKITTMKVHGNSNFALRLETVFMICTICINVVSISLLFANIL
jgi:hypothetical protein